MKATCALLLSLSAEQSQTVRAFSPRGKNQVLLPSSITHPRFMNEAFSGKHHFALEQFQEEINHLSNRTERQRACVSFTRTSAAAPEQPRADTAAAFGLRPCTAAAEPSLEHFYLPNPSIILPPKPFGIRRSQQQWTRIC